MAKLKGWYKVEHTEFWHYFADGVAACGRFVEKQASRVRPRGEGAKRCMNCMRSTEKKLQGKIDEKESKSKKKRKK